MKTRTHFKHRVDRLDAAGEIFEQPLAGQDDDRQTRAHHPGFAIWPKPVRLRRFGNSGRFFGSATTASGLGGSMSPARTWMIAANVPMNAMKLVTPTATVRAYRR
jgi:hypothetical protein